MGAITTAANAAFRDYNTDGIPGSGPHSPVKSDIRTLFGNIDSAISGGGGGAELVISNTDDIAQPLPYNFDSGALQCQGGASFKKSMQVKAFVYVGDGTTGSGISGQVGLNINGAASGANGGAYLDFDTNTNQFMTLGNASAVLNNGSGFDATPMLKLNSGTLRVYSSVLASDAFKIVSPTSGTNVTLFGPGSGTSGGEAIIGQTISGAAVWGIGHYSAILNGSYDASMAFYSLGGHWKYYSVALGGDAAHIDSPATGTTLSLFAPSGGTGAGSAIVGNGVWAFGHASGILGGAYDATALIYNVSAAYRFSGLTAGIIKTSANGTVSVAAAGQIPGTATNDDAPAGDIGEYLAAAALNNTINFTVTIASPGVVTQTAHGYSNTGTAAFVASTTGALPTGLVAGTVYWTIPGTVTANTFQLATSIANAFAGTAINTTGTQSGTHTGKSSIPLTSATAGVCAAIKLTAGDWDVTGLGLHDIQNTTAPTQLITNVSATIGGDLLATSIGTLQANFPTTGSQNTISVANVRESVATTQIMYLVAYDTFTVSTARACGQISARRRR